MPVISDDNGATGAAKSEGTPAVANGRKYKAHRRFMDRRQGVSGARTFFYEGEPECDRNADIFCRSIDKGTPAVANGRKYKAHRRFMDRRQGVSGARTFFYEGEPECDRNADIFCRSIDKGTPAVANGRKYKAHRRFMDRRQGVSGARTFFYEGEPECDRNADIFCRSIDKVAAVTNSTGLVAIKLTALGRPQFLLQLSSVIAEAQRFYQMLTGCSWEDLVYAKISEQAFQQKLADFGIKTDGHALKDWFSQVDFDSDGFVDVFEWSQLLESNFKLANLFSVVNLKTGKMEPLLSQMT